MNMKLRYRLFLRRKSVYYAFDDTTKTFASLKTKDKAEANRLLMAMNEAGQQPAMNLSLARVYLRHSDPLVTTRTWRNVLDEIIALKTGPTQTRWKSAAKDKAFSAILDQVLIETQAEHLLAVLRSGTVSTNAFLRKVHNFAVDMNWLALSSHTGSQLIRSISTVANHLRAFCAGLPSGLRWPARIRNGR